jgi:hypothetical protein
MPDRIPTVVCLDVEDLVTPETDDAALWMSQIMTETGVTGSFMVVGEKARLWEKRGRRDVIESFKRHHIGYHSTWHSVHPTTTEICLERNFAEGMEALLAWDGQGWLDAERIFGRPLLGWGRTGSSWGPSIMGVMGEKGRAYAYSPVRLPGHNVCWYAGCLSFYDDGFGGVDETLYNTARFEARLEQIKSSIDAFVQSDHRGAVWLCAFLGHPTRVVSTRFWDDPNFVNGANPPREQWVGAPLQDAGLIPTMHANYRRICQVLHDDSRLEIIGWGDLIRRYDGQKPFATHTDLLALAQQVADAQRVLFSDEFSAAEILLMLCEAAAGTRERYARPFAYGPLEMPPVMEAGELNAAEVLAAAHSVTRYAAGGYLPSSVTAGSQIIGIGTYYVALAQALLGALRVSGPADAPYPDEAAGVAGDVNAQLPGWVIHPRNMDLSTLVEQAQLQCWTLKPAWERSDLGM